MHYIFNFKWSSISFLQCFTAKPQDCVPKKSLEKCDKCIKSDQCKVGYCCPYIKKCILDTKTLCYPPTADCSPACSDHLDENSCTCKNSDFPNKWAKPTCTGIWILTLLYQYVWEKFGDYAFKEN